MGITISPSALNIGHVARSATSRVAPESITDLGVAVTTLGSAIVDYYDHRATDRPDGGSLRPFASHRNALASRVAELATNDELTVDSFTAAYLALSNSVAGTRTDTDGTITHTVPTDALTAFSAAVTAPAPSGRGSRS